MKLLDELKREHEKVQEMMLRIENIQAEKEKLFGEMVVAVLAHHEAEIAIVFEALTEEKESKKLNEELIAEHDCLRRQLQVILDFEDEDKWKANYTAAKEIFHHHMKVEENELFSLIHRLDEDGGTTPQYMEFEQTPITGQRAELAPHGKPTDVNRVQNS